MQQYHWLFILEVSQGVIIIYQNNANNENRFLNTTKYLEKVKVIQAMRVLFA